MYHSAQKPEPKAKAKGNGRAGNRRPAAEVAPVMRNRRAEKGIAGKLSNRIGREAWKQAERKRKAKGTKETGAHRGTHCEGETGRGEKKKQRLSSQNLNGSGRKNAEARENTSGKSKDGKR